MGSQVVQLAARFAVKPERTAAFVREGRRAPEPPEVRRHRPA